MSEEAEKPKEGEEGFTPPPKPLMERMREFQEYEANKDKPTEEKPAEELVEPHTSIEDIKESLKKSLYDDTIVDDYAEAFMAVKDKESLDKIIEILAFKESEIVRLTKHESAFKSQSNPDAQATKKDEPVIDPVEAILAQRYK